MHARRKDTVVDVWTGQLAIWTTGVGVTGSQLTLDGTHALASAGPPARSFS